MEPSISKLEAITVKGIVIHKALNKSFLKRVIGYGADAGVFVQFTNPETGKECRDYIRVEMKTYWLAQTGDILELKAYKGIKDVSKVYLKPDDALWN